jgi:hypothetical protein
VSDLRASDLDLARAYAEGTLAGPLRAEVERRLGSDPELARLVALSSEVWEATDAAVPPRPERPAPSFTEPLERPSLARPVAWAAAAALVLGVGAWAAQRALREPEPSGPVLLRAVPLEPVPVAEVPAPPTDELARYSPSDGAGVRLVDGIERGLALARAAGKPLLVFFYAPQCPLCIEVATGPLLDDEVAAAAEPFVVARQDIGQKMPEAIRTDLRHLPGFAVFDRDGHRSTSFPATTEAAPLVERLATEAEAHARAHGPALSWDAVHALANDLVAAADERDPARRRALWEKVAAADPRGALGDVARARLQRERAEARFALLAAEAAARASGASAALPVLDDALARFRGSRYEPDLRAVRDRVAQDDAFPRLETAR